jgi:hypothetical protein
MKDYYTQVADLLMDKGFSYLCHGKGPHEIWTTGAEHVLVPFNCTSRHTANAILKAAGIDQKL